MPPEKSPEGCSTVTLLMSLDSEILTWENLEPDGTPLELVRSRQRVRAGVSTYHPMLGRGHAEYQTNVLQLKPFYAAWANYLYKGF
jgi:hypothetical protein